MKIERNYLFTCHNIPDKEKKGLAILNVLARREAVSRTEISKITNINMASISNYIKECLDKRLIFETGQDASTGGRKPELIELDKSANYVIGIDTLQPEIRAVLADIKMNVIKRVKAPGSGRDNREIAAEIIRLIEDLIVNSGIIPEKIRAVGMGTKSDDFDDIAGEIEARFKISVFYGDDICCEAFGEKGLNPSADVGRLIYIHSDIGYAVAVKDDLFFKAVKDKEKMAIYGERGTENDDEHLFDKLKYLRPWNKAFSIVEAAKQEVVRGVGTKIVGLLSGDTDRVTTKAVIDAAKQNDEVALNIMQNVGANLGLRVAYLVNLFNPEAVVLGGGMEDAGDLFLNPVKEMVRKFAFKGQISHIRIMPGSLGKEAVSLGAASLAIREIFLRI